MDLGTQAFTATGEYSGGSSAALASGVIWPSSGAAVNIVSRSGVGTARRVGSEQAWLQIGSGAAHSLAISSSGDLWTCGLNEQGQLELGSLQSQDLPQRLP
ncbi:MAG: hypothetical protein IT500_14820 [Rubrivivax sp.]|nr:hypothetical protein [Rubrivivax sp.]